MIFFRMMQYWITTTVENIFRRLSPLKDEEQLTGSKQENDFSLAAH